MSGLIIPPVVVLQILEAKSAKLYLESVAQSATDGSKSLDTSCIDLDFALILITN